VGGDEVHGGGAETGGGVEGDAPESEGRGGGLERGRGRQGRKEAQRQACVMD
jgi:hypothetical protein